MRVTTFFLGCSVLVLPGCPGDDGGGAETGSSDGSGSDGSGGSSGATATGGQSETSVGTTATSSTSAGTDATSGSSGADGSSGGADESTGAADPCVGLSREECAANRACTVLQCNPYEMAGDPGVTPWCIGDAEFVGCQSAEIGCDDVRTTTCEGDDAAVFLCPTSCIPPGWLECPAPVDGEVPMCGG